MSTLAVAESPVDRSIDRSRLRRAAAHLSIAGQLVLALLVIHQFQLESRTFFRVALLAAAGVVPHAVLPLAWRLPAFALLSAAGLAVAVGPGDAAWIVAVGATLVAICHLPVRASLRGVLLVAAAVALAAGRSGHAAVPWSAAAWAALGSMLMFRLALYFHAVRHEPTRPTATQAAAYFLMLPNPVFPLFPVVDFTTFMRSHYARDAVEIYQTGMRWIARGLLHLLLYRIVYQHLPADPLELSGLAELLWYVLGTFLLYLRVSGQFHLIVGMLRLYGFDLPETHRLFFLSSSFTDFWRRINIYWKDFMMKLVYYPSFFWLRRWGNRVALVVSTAAVFVVTWFLHSYQWFWLLGTFPHSLPDVLFWGILGAFVVVSALRESARGRDRSLGARGWSARLAGRTLATFCALCVLWSLWSASSLAEWGWMWRAAANVDALGIALLVALGGVGLAVAGRNWTPPARSVAAPARGWRRADVATVATLVLLLVLSRPAVDAVAGPAAPLLAAMRRTTLNASDAAVERRGYYEQLDRGPRLGAQGWETRGARPADWIGPLAAGVLRPLADFMRYDLTPSNRLQYLRAELTTNAWGMRDRPRELVAASGTRRVAIFGPSLVMGSGVADDATFPAVLERRLNETRGRWEVLNFGVTGHSLVQEVARLDALGMRFSPDVVMLTTYSSMRDQTADHLAFVVKNGYAVPYAGLDSVLRRWRVSSALPWTELRGLLRVAADDVHEWALARVAAECRARGITPMLVAINLVGVRADDDRRTLRTAERLGFRVVNLSDVYGPEAGHARLVLAPWDNHPNATASRLIADRLLGEL